MRRHHGRAPSPFAGRTPVPPSADVTLVRSFDHELNPARPVRQSPLAASQFQGMPLDLIDRIRSFPLFSDAPDAFLFEIGLALKPSMYKPNDYIITEGEDAKAMYWIVRGAVAVTSRDGESTYAELRPGSFVGEIGILLDRPRTATVIARAKCLTLQLKSEDLKRILPRFPTIERAITEEALERLAILEKKKQQKQSSTLELRLDEDHFPRRGSKRPRENGAGSDADSSGDEVLNKKRKSPSPSIDGAVPSALGHGLVNVRSLLKELPLFANLPPEVLHFFGLNAQPRTYPPFVDIIKQGTPGREIYFIVHGEVEVLAQPSNATSPPPSGRGRTGRNSLSPLQTNIVARLKSGQYFGEAASLSLVDRRSATIRSVSQVEALIIPEVTLEEFWRRCPPLLKKQIEDTAKQRLRKSSSTDTDMQDADYRPDRSDLGMKENGWSGRGTKGKVKFDDVEAVTQYSSDDSTTAEPLDPDPFSSSGLDNVKSRSRRGSLAPPSPDEPVPKPKSRKSPRSSPAVSPMSSVVSSPPDTPSVGSIPMEDITFSDSLGYVRDRLQRTRSAHHENGGTIPDELLIIVLQRFELHELMLMQRVSFHWQHILTTSNDVLKVLDLSRYNRSITDQLLIKRICPFVRHRPRTINLNNCFHLTDAGFTALVELCGNNVTTWSMKSVWEVTANAVADMSTKTKELTNIDLSNCRKVSDQLLTRLIGWVVPSPPQNHANHQASPHRGNTPKRPTIRTLMSNNKPAPSIPPQGTVIGCPKLTTLSLSYCKHVSDRTMYHIAQHAASRMTYLDLTRCTTISDNGFVHWSHAPQKFSALHTLILADCTYLSDQAIINLVQAAGVTLRHLDLSFCCALSDISTEVLSMGAIHLESLDMSFCGSAISDNSLRQLGNNLKQLKHLKVRGCVRVTGTGVDAVIAGCTLLEYLDVSQCRNIEGWLRKNGPQLWRNKGRNVVFEFVARDRNERRGD